MRALVPMVALVLLLVWLQQPSGQQVRTVDPAPDVSYAMTAAPYRLVAPRGLPSEWRATSSQVAAPAGEGHSPVTLDIGYLTPAGKYARFVVSDLPVDGAVDAAVPGSVRDGSATVAGADWARYRTPKGEVLLVRKVGPATAVLTGNAGMDEFGVLAGSLR